MSQAPTEQEPGTKPQSALSKFGDKVKAGAQKAADSVKKFAADTKADYENAKSMQGLITMASTDFEKYLKKRANTTDKVIPLKEVADSFKNAEGICFVASFNVAFTVGGGYGRGIVMKRLGPGNWSMPLAIQEIEANVGWQINLSRSKAFYVLRNDQAIRNFQQKGNAKLGGKGFAALGNMGGQAQANVKSSKESLTKTTGDAAEVAATNASVGSVKGLAFGANVNLGTFQPSKKINEGTYDNFDIAKLFDKGLNDLESGSDEEKADDAANKLKVDGIVAQLKEFIEKMEACIEADKTMDAIIQANKQAQAAAKQ